MKELIIKILPWIPIIGIATHLFTDTFYRGRYSHKELLTLAIFQAFGTFIIWITILIFTV